MHIVRDGVEARCEIVSTERRQGREHSGLYPALFCSWDGKVTRQEIATVLRLRQRGA